MGHRNRRKTFLHVEVMEEKLVLSSLAHAAPGVHPAVTRRPSDIRSLTPQLTGADLTAATVLPRTGVVTLQGTIIEPSDFAASNPGVSLFAFNVTVTEAIGRSHSVTGTGTAIIGVNSSSTPVSFTVSLTASNGKFGRGWATVSLPDYSTSYDLDAEWLALLKR